MSLLTLPGFAANVTPPDEVRQLRVDGVGVDVVLSWNAVTTDMLGGAKPAASYRVYRGDFAAFVPDRAAGSNLIGTPTAAGFVDGGARTGPQAHYYLASAVDDAGVEGNTRVSKVGQPFIATVSFGSGAVTLSWTQSQPVDQVGGNLILWGLAPRTYETLIERAATTSDIVPLPGFSGDFFFTVASSDLEGNISPFSAEIALNLQDVGGAPPGMTTSISPDSNQNGWNNTDVEMSFVCDFSRSQTRSRGSDMCPGPIVVTTEGAGQVVSGTATNSAGSSTTISAVVNIDKTPPSINVLPDPQPNAAGWISSTEIVSFCEDALSGIDSCPPPLPVVTEGTGLVFCRTAVDRASNTTEACTQPLSIDQTAPSVSASIAPEPNANGWNNTDVIVTFDATDALSGVAEVVDPIVVGSEGVHVIQGAAIDVAGNTGTTSRNVRIDETPPLVTVTLPDAVGLFVVQSPIRVEVGATDANPIESVTVNGQPATLMGATYEATVSVDPGLSAVIATAVDIAGNAATGQAGVNLCTQFGTPCDTGVPGVCAAGSVACNSDATTFCQGDSGPQPEACNDGIDQNCDGSDCVLLLVDIQSPAPGFVTAASTAVVSGTVGSGVDSVSVSGVTATVNGSTFEATVPLRPGANMLVAVATDPGGNTGTDSLLVTRDTVAPNVQINSPLPGFRAIVDRVTVTGIVNDLITGGVAPQVTVNGVPAFVQQGTFMALNVPLVRGPNTLVATAVDSVGNQGSSQIQISFAPPAGARLVPVSGDGQVGLVGEVLPEQLIVQVVDNAGNPLASRVVRFRVIRDNGVLSAANGQVGRTVSVTSDGAGLARVALTLGNRSGEGNNRVSASSIGASGEAIFCATAQPAVADKVLAVMGENQTGQVGSPLPEPFEILLVDIDGNPVAGVPVTYSALAGDGHFDGLPTKEVLTDADGVARAVLTLGPVEGANNNRVAVNFPNNPGLAATFVASAVVAGAPAATRFAGVVLDNTNTAIPGATIHIPGSAGDVLTDVDGQFLVEGVPVGAIHLEVDPTTSPRPETFPHLAFEASTVAGMINRLPTGPIRIPPLVSDARIAGGDQDVVLEMPGVPGLTLTIFANSVTFQDGSTEGPVSINQVHLDKLPMPPPSGTIMMPPAWTVQPPGVHFDPPARVTVPNDGLPPGRVVDIFQFDHALNRFVNVGPGTTDDEGLLIVQDEGFGITESGWGGCGQPQPPQTCASSCDDGNPCTMDSCVNGSCVHTPITRPATAANMCEACNNGTLVPKQTDAQCCASVSFTGGYVVCCNTQKLACVGNGIGNGGNAAGGAIVKECARQHEVAHFPHVNCPTGANECNTTRPPFKPGQDAGQGECDASKVEVACLQAANCAGDAACQARVDARITQIKNYGNSNKPGCFPP